MSGKTGVIRVPIEVVYPDLPEPPPAPSEMDTVQGRDAWEAGWYAAIDAVEDRAIPAQSARYLDLDDPASVGRLARVIHKIDCIHAEAYDPERVHIFDREEAREYLAALVAEAK